MGSIHPNCKYVIMHRKCPECGDRIIGRVDKKFCSDGCRNAHNNRINKDSKNLIRNTNNRLRKNYRILEALNPNKKTKCSRAKLIERGLILIISQVSIRQKQGRCTILCTIKVTCL